MSDPKPSEKKDDAAVVVATASTPEPPLQTLAEAVSTIAATTGAKENVSLPRYVRMSLPDAAHRIWPDLRVEMRAGVSYRVVPDGQPRQTEDIPESAVRLLLTAKMIERAAAPEKKEEAEDQDGSSAAAAEPMGEVVAIGQADAEAIASVRGVPVEEVLGKSPKDLASSSSSR